MKLIRYSIGLLLVAATSIGCARKPPENVSELAGKFKLIDARLAKSGYVVATRAVDVSALQTHEGHEYRVYTCTSAVPSLLQIQVSLATNGALLVDSCAISARGQSEQELKDMSDIQGTVGMDLHIYWMTNDQYHAQGHIDSATLPEEDARTIREDTSMVWLSKQLRSKKKDLEEVEIALSDEVSKSQHDKLRVQKLQREVEMLKMTCDGLVQTIAEYEERSSKAEPTTEPYSK